MNGQKGKTHTKNVNKGTEKIQVITAETDLFSVFLNI